MFSARSKNSTEKRVAESPVVAVPPQYAAANRTGRVGANDSAVRPEAPFVEVCGHGWHSLADGLGGIVKKFAEPPFEAMANIDTKLLTSRNEKERSLGLYLQSRAGSWAE